ncbi:Pleckstrin homology domain-containing protein [Favolaschia claudopus]|uniref:Pleckstrin homology domain-containing protein n=1 Tax=Favolaschia claudopus TaxID=2862362 RepID=A0AAW0BSH5_9AGAR
MTLKRGSFRDLLSIFEQQANSSYSNNSSGRTSPSPSFAASTHQAMTEYNSSSSHVAPTLGFVLNLNQTNVKRDGNAHSVCSDDSTRTSITISISDEELALLGAPWAKEGMLCRKQYWESAGKRAKDKAWLVVFVVIQKGELNMFTFEDANSGVSGTFGGGNWLSNAKPVGTIQLAHSLAHSLPSPGYNRQRPYCMVLTLANGGVYFYQANTEELLYEWVSTCNYHAARTSKEPLGINLPWADPTFINEWKPPMLPTVSSTHDEEKQLEALRQHVASVKRGLEQHSEYHESMAALYQPRSAKSVKAQSNWEKMSQYLLAEIVKYDSYIDSLQSAMSIRLKKQGEKGLQYFFLCGKC